VIDGVDALTASWHYAGLLGLWPVGMSLRRLCLMAEGKSRASRQQSLELSQLVWGLSQIDLLKFIVHGEITDHGIGEEVTMTAEQRQSVDDQVKTMRKDNPDALKPRFG